MDLPLRKPDDVTELSGYCIRRRSANRAQLLNRGPLFHSPLCVSRIVHVFHPLASSSAFKLTLIGYCLLRNVICAGDEESGKSSL